MSLFIGNVLEVSIMILSCFFYGYALHEYIHYRIADKDGLKPKVLRFKGNIIVETARDGTLEQQKNNIKKAVIIGALPSLFAAFFFGLYALVPLALYLYGCKTDIKKWRLL